MKAISLWQPWASAITLGLKKNETRSWSTSYRGPLLIHAAKRKMIMLPALLFLIKSLGMNPSNLPYGKLLCKVNLIDCQQIGDDNCPFPDSVEYQLGNYDHGRWMWITDNMKNFYPIPFQGKQGFFEVPDEIVKGLF